MQHLQIKEHLLQLSVIASALTFFNRKLRKILDEKMEYT